MRVDGNTMRMDSDMGQLAARNAMTAARPETAIDREPDGDSDDVQKVALQSAQKAPQINTADAETGTKVNLLA